MFSSAFIRRVVNGAWIASFARDHAKFKVALGQVEDVQSGYLINLIARNAHTQFGIKHRFSRIHSVAEYQECVPVRTYESLSQDIEEIASGKSAVLTADRVTRFHPTSGSSAANKLIPWTNALGREFKRGISPWMFELYRRKTGLAQGTAYWSVSPPNAALRTYGRLRVGFDHDAEYLGFLGRRMHALVSVTPSGVAQCERLEDFKIRTLVALLMDRNLSLISIWSPTFLTVLLEFFLTNAEGILASLTKKESTRERAEFLKSALDGSPGSSFFQRAWPNLKIISCWTHGPSEIYAENLRRIFPYVEIQGKGLLSTEAFISLPFHESMEPVLAINSHFFEFENPANGKFCLAHDLEVGVTYRVVVTTGGGLYRYSLGDLIKVTGFIEQAPCLRFVGREGNVSDLFGEKLQGVFVEGVIQRSLSRHGVVPRFFLLAPTTDGSKTSYTLFLETDDVGNAGKLMRELESELAQSFHYGHCRRLGQLAEAQLFRINRNSTSPETVFEREMVNRGLKLGDIKAVPLDDKFGWEHRFLGHFIA
jgi:hypothetical protein